MLDDRRARATRDRIRDESVPIALIAEREEALTAFDQTGVVRPTGETQNGIRAAAHDPPTARGEESFEREQRRRC